MRKVLFLRVLEGGCGGCGEKLIFYNVMYRVVALVAAGGVRAAAALLCALRRGGGRAPKRVCPH